MRSPLSAVRPSVAAGRCVVSFSRPFVRGSARPGDADPSAPRLALSPAGWAAGAWRPLPVAGGASRPSCGRASVASGFSPTSPEPVGLKPEATDWGADGETDGASDGGADGAWVLEAGSAEEAVATVKGHEGGIDLIFAEEWLNAAIEKKVLPKLGLRRNPPAVLYTDHSGAPMEHLVRLKQPYLRHELVSRVREMLGQTREERLLSAFSLKQLKKSDLSRRKEGDSPQPCERPSP